MFQTKEEPGRRPSHGFVPGLSWVEQEGHLAGVERAFRRMIGSEVGRWGEGRFCRAMKATVMTLALLGVKLGTVGR